MIYSILFSHYFYLVVLLIGIGGLTLADWRLQLVFFDNFIPALKSISILVVILLAADIAGIKLEIFSTNQNFVTGIHIFTPNLPIEEIFFLFLLSYLTLVLYQIIKKFEIKNQGEIK